MRSRHFRGQRRSHLSKIYAKPDGKSHASIHLPSTTSCLAFARLRLRGARQALVSHEGIQEAGVFIPSFGHTPETILGMSLPVCRSRSATKFLCFQRRVCRIFEKRQVEPLHLDHSPSYSRLLTNHSFTELKHDFLIHPESDRSCTGRRDSVRPSLLAIIHLLSSLMMR